MSVNHARRHRALSDLPIRELPAGDRWRDVLVLRHRLAVTAAAYAAHQVDGALDLLQLQIETEERIRSLAPEIYHAHSGEWADLDTSLEHTWPARHPDCSICRILVVDPQISDTRDDCAVD